MLVDDFRSSQAARPPDRVGADATGAPLTCTTPAPEGAPPKARRAWLALGAVGVCLATAAALLFVRRTRARRHDASLRSTVARTIPDPRPRLVRAALSAIDQRRRPPCVASPRTGLADALEALRRPTVPRVLSYVSVKRINPRVGDTFGHWWIEVDGTESYGWWPDRCPIRLRDFLFGTHGTVNGLRGTCAGGTTTTDPRHLQPATHTFHPTLLVRKSDRRVRTDIRRFAQGFRGEWRWSTKPTSNDCRSFQLRLFQAVGLEEGPTHVHTRGRGCPFMALVRPTPHIRRFATSPASTRRIA
ncbi:MAG: hypothetical protein ACRDWD_16160 [Acidimicrobiia bacterium]